ncbi:MAG: Cell cycle protein GpsB [Ignavibacteria bacterium]|nr:Cell cycle protein GpsB [Ignavibacteria bacterium]
MSISPKDIKKTDFRKAFRGYDANEVDAFLETLSLRFERLVEDNANLSEKARNLSTDLEVYKENESTLQKAIVKAQDITEEVINNAKKKAENIIKEAELNSQKLFQDMEKEILNKKHELEEIKLRNDKLVEDVKLFFLEKLNEMEEFIKNRNIYSMELTHVRLKDEIKEDSDDEITGEVKLKKVSINTTGSGTTE